MQLKDFCKFLLILGGVMIGLLLFKPDNLRAHCDAVNGPVAEDARQALSEGEFREVAIWVGEEQTAELLSAFEKTLPVYEMGGNAEELAEQYFMETAVRLHREAEGFPYKGLKPPQPLPPDVAAAERSLKSGNPEPVLNLLTIELENKVMKLYKEARQAGEKKGESLEAGREWADAYVQYVIYVHGLHQTIQAGPEHGVGE